MGPANQCPVCQARFRGARVCSRCGANLEPLMRLAANAWRLREAARQALAGGDFDGAFRIAAQAQQLQRTPGGNALRAISAWLQAHCTDAGIVE